MNGNTLRIFFPRPFWLTADTVLISALSNWYLKKTQRCPTSFIAAAPFCYSVKQEQLLLLERGQLLWTMLLEAHGDVDHRSLLWDLGSWVSWEISQALNADQEGEECCRGSSMHSMSPLYIHFLEMIQAHEITWQLPV